MFVWCAAVKNYEKGKNTHMSSLKIRYRSCSNSELIRVVLSPEVYTEQAIDLARQELDGRQVSSEEYKIVKLILLEEQNEANKKVENRRLQYATIQNQVRTLIDTVNPIQPTEASTYWKIRILCVLMLIITFQNWSASIYDLKYLVPGLFHAFELATVVYIALLLLLPIATVYMYLKKWIGWVLSSVASSTNLLFVILALISSIDYHYFSQASVFEEGGGDLRSLISIYAPPDSVTYIPSLALYAAMIFLLNQKDVLSMFGVNKITQLKINASMIVISVLAVGYIFLS